MTESLENSGLESFVESWDAAGLGPAVLPAGAGALVVLRRGARVVPFDDVGRPMLWLAPDVLPGRQVRTWAATGAWNLGAERLWIGPEWRLMVRDRADFLGTYALSSAMDPGDWSLEATDAEAVLGTHMSLSASQPSGRLALDVQQTISPAADPARRLEESAGLRHLGWSRDVALERGAADDGDVACQSWVLAQVEAPATVLVPGAGANAVTDYFEPVDDLHLRPGESGLTIALSGRRRFKVGVRTGANVGSVAAWREGPGDTGTLFVRYFQDTPSSRYLEEPPGRPGHEGDSVYVYNDDGRFGDFGEVEALGKALEPGERSVRDRFEMHCWWGPQATVARLAVRLFGAEPVATGRDGLAKAH
ncbi:MAG TPA: hypothetical protein VF164_08135 [Trueperaceae bacterium]